jgi:cytochrome c oxidase assembly protein subunit 15
MRDLRRFSVSPELVRKVALLVVIAYGVLVVTGGAVRLTGSGLGCPDWPSCYQHRLVAALSFHPLVENVNRFVTIGVSILSIAACGFALLRSPRRKDISIPAIGIMGGLAAQIVLGGLVVLTSLNPYLVALHFLLTIAVLGVAIAFYHRSRIPDSAASSAPQPLVASDLRWLVLVIIGSLAVMSTLGTLVTGAGPHAGGPGAKRIPIAFHSIAEVHSSIGWLILGLAGGSVFAFHHARAPERVQRLVRGYFELVVVQGALGYTQYFLHDSPVVVEFHLAGATVLWITAIGLYLSLHEHPVSTGAAAASDGESQREPLLSPAPASVG